MNNKFEQIFLDFYSPLCNYASRIIKDDMLSEDLVQDLFMEFLEKSSLEEVEHIERYLLRATKFKCYKYLKSNGKQVIIPLEELSNTDESSEVSDLKEEDIDSLFYYFTAKLPPKTREVFLLSRKEKLTYIEISQKLDISVKTVEKQIGRALRKMREVLKENNFLSFFFI